MRGGIGDGGKGESWREMENLNGHHTIFKTHKVGFEANIAELRISVDKNMRDGSQVNTMIVVAEVSSVDENL